MEPVARRLDERLARLEEAVEDLAAGLAVQNSLVVNRSGLLRDLAHAARERERARLAEAVLVQRAERAAAQGAVA